MLNDLLKTPCEIELLSLDHLRGIRDRLIRYITLREQGDPKSQCGLTAGAPRMARTVGAAGAMGMVRSAGASDFGDRSTPLPEDDRWG